MVYESNFLQSRNELLNRRKHFPRRENYKNTSFFGFRNFRLGAPKTIPEINESKKLAAKSLLRYSIYAAVDLSQWYRTVPQNWPKRRESGNLNYDCNEVKLIYYNILQSEAMIEECCEITSAGRR